MDHVLSAVSPAESKKVSWSLRPRGLVLGCGRANDMTNAISDQSGEALVQMRRSLEPHSVLQSHLHFMSMFLLYEETCTRKCPCLSQYVVDDQSWK